MRSLTVYRVTCGSLVRDYATDYHAEQMASALRRHPPLAGTPVTVETIRLPDDPLTRLTTINHSAATLHAGAL
jgi:hypothetical protein